MLRLKILFDECLDRRLTKKIKNHWVKTVVEMGWAGFKNGELLTKAQSKFDVFITNDQNLSFQQNLPRYTIAVVVLCPKSNRLEDFKLIFPKVLEKLNNLKIGQAIFIKAD